MRLARLCPASGLAITLLLAAPAWADPCEVVDNGTGTITLPPAGCEYLSPDEVHLIIDGLPPGTTIELAPIHKDFICDDPAGLCTLTVPPGACEVPGGSLGGNGDCFGSALQLQVTGTGALAGFARTLFIQVQTEVHTAPRNPGDPVQDFDTEMVQLQGDLFGDPDFAFLQIRGGALFGLPSPGHTTLTDLGNGSWNVDSFFDVIYTIDFQGAPGSVLEGLGGSTQGTIRMQAGVPLPPPGNPCTVVDNGSGTVTLPPQGCEYLSPDEVHQIIDGLPPGTTIELAAIHKDFLCGQPGGPPPGCSVTMPPGACEVPGGSLGGNVDCAFSAAELAIRGTGALAGFQRTIVVPLDMEVHTGPRQPGDPVQTFPNEMVRLQGEISGDPDFDPLLFRAGSAFGLPSPGHTTLTRLGPPGSDFQVDSFFDVSYEIEFQGAPGGQLDGLSGTTQGTVRMSTGSAAGAPPPLTFSLDDNPAAPITSPAGLIPGFGAEDPFGLAGPAGAPSPSLGLLGVPDSGLLSPGPVVQIVPTPGYIDSVSTNHPVTTLEHHLLFSPDRRTRGMRGSIVTERAKNQHMGDVYGSTDPYVAPALFVGALGAPPPAPPVFLGAWLGPFASNWLIVDEGAGPPLVSLPALGLLAGAGAPLPSNVQAPPIGAATHDNVDAFDLSPVDFDFDGIFDVGTYYTLGPDEALAAGGSPADIFWVPAGSPGPGILFAAPFMMGLDVVGGFQSDSIDGLVMYDAGFAVGDQVEPGADFALFSLAPGSATLAFYGLSASDVFFTDFTGAFGIYTTGFDLGLIPAPGAPPLGGDDNVDALEAIDAQDAEFDYDLDGVINLADNCWHRPNPLQVDFDGDALGDVCDACPRFVNGLLDDQNADGVPTECQCGDFTGEGLFGFDDANCAGQCFLGGGAAPAPCSCFQGVLFPGPSGVGDTNLDFLWGFDDAGNVGSAFLSGSGVNLQCAARPVAGPPPPP